MRLTYTLLVVSLHKIHVLVCFAAPLNTRQAFDLRHSVRASTSPSTALLAGRLLTLRCERTHSKCLLLYYGVLFFSVAGFDHSGDDRFTRHIKNPFQSL